MGVERDAMTLVRAELCCRLEALRATADELPFKTFVQNVDGLRRLAAAYGLTPVVRLASALEHSLYEGQTRRTRLSTLYLERLSDAIGCDRMDEPASQAMVASVAVRLGA